MRRIMGWLVPMAALALAACGPEGGGGAVASAGSVAAGVADAAHLAPPAALVPSDWQLGAAKAVDLSFTSLEAASYGVDALISLGRIETGTPAAIELSDKLGAVLTFLKAARAAVAAGSAESYVVAMDQAKLAWEDANRAIARYKGESR